MGVIAFLPNSAEISKHLSAAKSSMQAQGFEAPVTEICHFGQLVYAEHPLAYDSLYVINMGRSMALVNGPMIYQGQARQVGLERLLQQVLELERKQQDPQFSLNYSDFVGNFSVLICTPLNIYAFSDELNLCTWYLGAEGAIATSWLLLAELVNEPRLNIQAAREFILFEGVHQDQSLVQQIRKLGRTQVWSQNKSSQLGLLASHGHAYHSQNDSLDYCHYQLKAEFEQLAQAGDAPMSVALSAGFDSRLIFAIARHLQLDVRLFVYGQPEDEDRKIAEHIAHTLGQPIQAIDKNKYVVKASAPPSAYHFFDGHFGDTIFAAEQDIDTRLLQGLAASSGSKVLVLNGGGGEILRDFFSLKDKAYSLSAVYAAFYGRDSLLAFQRAADRQEFIEQVQANMAHAVASSARELSRPQVEQVYAYFRCQHWMGRNNHLANRYASFLTPLISPALVAHSSHIPIKHKIAGQFESQLIKSFDAQLAAFPSSYGFDFASGPSPRAIAAAQSKQSHPTWIRPYRSVLGQYIQGHRSKPAPITGNEKMEQLLPGRWQVDEVLGLRPAKNLADFHRRGNIELLIRQLKLSV